MLSVRPVALAIILFAGSLSAQVAGRLTGTIVDASGAVVPAASVSLTTKGGAVAATQTTTAEGIFSFTALQPGDYELKAESQGFTPATVTNIKIDPARETSLPAVTLQPASVTQSVEVVAPINIVQTNNAEIATTVTNEQVRRLPQLNRSIFTLINTQAGVGSNGRTNTVVNGLRTSYANVTLDGVNIQDNFLRENSLDFLPNLLLIDQISELSISSSNTPTSMGNGAAQISFATPSGTNTFHGGLYWYNRNNALAANDFFNNQAGIGLPRLNQNQGGGYIGGPILKNRLFFYANYELLRLKEQAAQQRTILTESARQGIFTYVAGGSVQQRNILQLTGNRIDPFMQSLINEIPTPDKINNFRTGDSLANLLRNTAGYSFLQRQNRTRDNVTGKLDYYASDRHSFFGTYAWNRDINDRPTVSQTTYTPVPSVANDNKTNLVSTGWRSTWSATFTNELRGGFNFAPQIFARTVPEAPYYVRSELNAPVTAPTLVFSNPTQDFQQQGRDTKTWNISDNASWIKGRHSISFGFQGQNIRVNQFDFQGIVPTYFVGLGTRTGLSSADLPGISGNDLIAANNLLATLAGFLSQGAQRFNVESQTSGFVPDQEFRRIYTFATYAGYFQDNWKMNRRLTLSAGLRYDYFTRVNESRNLALLPVLPDGNVINALGSNSSLDFAGTGIGRPWYGKDLNNFAPNVGIAWDVRGDGSTAIRAGYSVNFVNDNHISTLRNGPFSNDGLQVDRTIQNSSWVASNPGAISTPAFAVPRTFADNFANDRTTAFATLDPNLRTPYVQQWSLSIQQQFAGGVLEARYLGNHGTKQFRAFDYNQININYPGYLTDFRRAYNNGILALNQTGAFNPQYNPAIAGSQELPFFNQLPGGGSITNATVRNLILTQAAGDLANTYQTFGFTGPNSGTPISFYKNPFAQGTNLLTNYSNSSYNAFQVDYTRRYSRGYTFQANYTWSKSLSDSEATNQTNFEPFLDNNDAAIERAPTPFDLRHAFKANFVLDLPFGRGRRFLSGSGPVLSRLAGGWSVSGITRWQSGFPFSIRSERGTLNRAGPRSFNNTANTTLDGDQLSRAVSLYMTPNGPYIVDQLAINDTDGRGVAPDGRAPFNGQAFFNPGAGEIGSLQRRFFTGPSDFNFDFGIQKVTTIREGHTLEFRMESTNVFNNVMFDTTIAGAATLTTDYNINSTTFGKITTQANTPRRVQFGLYYRF